MSSLTDLSIQKLRYICLKLCITDLKLIPCSGKIFRSRNKRKAKPQYVFVGVQHTTLFDGKLYLNFNHTDTQSNKSIIDIYFEYKPHVSQEYGFSPKRFVRKIYNCKYSQQVFELDLFTCVYPLVVM